MRVHGRAFAHVVCPAVLNDSWHSELVRQVGSFGELSNWSETETRSSVGRKKQTSIGRGGS
jgi:hypothetical protein